MLDILPRFTHIINPKLKHIYLSFGPKGELVIKSPEVPQKEIEKLLLKKAGWISNAQKKLHAKKGKPIDFSGNCELYYLGKTYPLQLLAHEKKRTLLRFEEEQFRLCYLHYDEITFQKHINRFYKNRAESHIPPLVEEWSRRMKLYPEKVFFRKTKRQWGSCSATNALSFNTMAMKLPHDVIEYIIVHELAHIKHKHHQKDFWELVAKHLPDYRERVKALKQYM